MKSSLGAALGLILAVALSMPGGGSGCGPGTTGGNPQVALSFDAYSPNASIFDFFITSAYASVSSLKLCFKRMRFKTQDQIDSGSLAGAGDIDLALGEVTLSSSGTTLTTVSVPAGTYKRIEFDLSKECASGKSVQLSNDAGSFSTVDGMTIKFEGAFVAAEAAQNLAMGVQTLITQLNTVATDGEIKTKAESASGAF